MPITAEIAGPLEVDPKEIWGLLYDPTIVDGVQGQDILLWPPATDVTPVTDVRDWPVIACYLGVFTPVGSPQIDAVILTVYPHDGAFASVGYVALTVVLPAPIGIPAGEWLACHYLPGWPSTCADSRIRVDVRPVGGAAGTVVRAILSGKRLA